jgi:hypothetical protein
MQAERRRTGTSIQQAEQIGEDERRGKEEPQSVQEAGRSAQLAESTGLRRTRAIARQAEVPGGGTSIVSEPESLRKTHLTWEGVGYSALNYIYTRSNGQWQA